MEYSYDNKQAYSRYIPSTRNIIFWKVQYFTVNTKSPVQSLDITVAVTNVKFEGKLINSYKLLTVIPKI